MSARWSSDGIFFYVRGECKASMKKVAYFVDLKITSEGNVEESHCDCTAGSGVHATCKHVYVLLCGVHEITEKKTIKLHQSCTQKIMDFHRPKKIFYNSPIAAANMPTKRKRSCNYNPLADEDIPKNYNDYVRNLAIGYGDSSMPIKQMYSAANPYGIAWDHYSLLAVTPQDILMEQLLLKNVNLPKIIELELKTKTQDRSPEWHEMRACRITSSLFYVVSHCTTGNKSLLQKILYPKKIQTRALIHGKVHEPIAIAQYEKKFDLKIEKSGLFICLHYPFLAASPDGLLKDETVIEVKCPYTARYNLINEGTVPYLINANGELALKKNHPYYAQIQGQLFCTGRKYCNFIIYTFIDMKVLFIQKDETYINNMLPNLINFNMHYLEPAILNKYIYKN